MKPKLGRKVYCIYCNCCIIVDTVYAVGKDSFFICPDDRDEDSIEWFYKDYEKDWFTSLAKAKQKLLDNYETPMEDRQTCYSFLSKMTIKPKIVKVDDDYYELQEVVK